MKLVIKLRIINLFLVCVGTFFWMFSVDVTGSESRPASIGEIQMLFDLATIGPQRLRVEANISTGVAPWSSEQIAAELKQQEQNMSGDLSKVPQQARSNAIARSHSGTRILHVQEWYSGKLYRLDQTDEAMVSPEYLRANVGEYLNSYVNIDTPLISPYVSFFVNHQLRNVQLSKSMQYGKNDLWRVLSLDEEVALPLLVALLDPKSEPNGRTATDADLHNMKIDTSKVAQISNGANKYWSIEAIMQNPAEKPSHFVLRSRFPSTVALNEFSSVDVLYWLGQAGGKTVCIEALFTNNLTHNSFASKRECFDDQGIPHVWSRLTMRSGLLEKKVDITIKQLELSPTFSDEQVFSPVFLTNYIVSDVTSGDAVIIKNPKSHAKTHQPPVGPKRTIILVLSILVSVGAGLLLICLRSNKATI